MNGYAIYQPRAATPTYDRKRHYMDQQKQKRENGGYLFKNADKRTDKQPDFRGKMNVAGKDWLISGWTRTKDGEEMISISVTDPATLPQRDGAAAGSSMGAAAARPSAPTPAGGFARKPAVSSPAQAPTPTENPSAGSSAAQSTKSFQPQAGKSAASAGYEDMEDLDSLFNGLDD